MQLKWHLLIVNRCLIRPILLLCFNLLCLIKKRLDQAYLSVEAPSAAPGTTCLLQLTQQRRHQGMLRIRLVYTHCIMGNVVQSVGRELFIFSFCTDYTVLHEFSKSHRLKNFTLYTGCVMKCHVLKYV